MEGAIPPFQGGIATGTLTTCARARGQCADLSPGNVPIYPKAIFLARASASRAHARAHGREPEPEGCPCQPDGLREAPLGKGRPKRPIPQNRKFGRGMKAALPTGTRPNAARGQVISYDVQSSQGGDEAHGDAPHIALARMHMRTHICAMHMRTHICACICGTGSIPVRIFKISNTPLCHEISFAYKALFEWIKAVSPTPGVTALCCGGVTPKVQPITLDAGLLHNARA